MEVPEVVVAAEERADHPGLYPLDRIGDGGGLCLGLALDFVADWLAVVAPDIHAALFVNR